MAKIFDFMCYSEVKWRGKHKFAIKNIKDGFFLISFLKPIKLRNFIVFFCTLGVKKYRPNLSQTFQKFHRH